MLIKNFNMINDLDRKTMLKYLSKEYRWAKVAYFAENHNKTIYLNKDDNLLLHKFCRIHTELKPDVTHFYSNKTKVIVAINHINLFLTEN